MGCRSRGWPSRGRSARTARPIPSSSGKASAGMTASRSLRPTSPSRSRQTSWRAGSPRRWTCPACPRALAGCGRVPASGRPAARRGPRSSGDRGGRLTLHARGSPRQTSSRIARSNDSLLTKFRRSRLWLDDSMKGASICAHRETVSQTGLLPALPLLVGVPRRRIRPAHHVDRSCPTDRKHVDATNYVINSRHCLRGDNNVKQHFLHLHFVERLLLPNMNRIVPRLCDECLATLDLRQIRGSILTVRRSVA